jgi:hypothetical protein
MIVFDGTYGWKGTTRQKRRVISWWRSTYHLRIVDLSAGKPGLRFMRTHAVLFADTGEGASVVNCVQELAKEICADFSLSLPRVLWVEERRGEETTYQVAEFKPLTTVGDEPFYQVSWREIRPRERELIGPYAFTPETPRR